MAIRKIVYVPEPCLRTPCKPIPPEEIQTPEFQTLIDDMFETMYDANGIGLAANQIGLTIRMTVIDIEGDKKNQLVLINPEIIDRSGSEMMSAGCLSVPGEYDSVERSTWVKVKALDREGKPFEIEGEDLFGHCLQHEIDHLDGRVFIDYLSKFKRQRMQQRVNKFAKNKKKEGK